MTEALGFCRFQVVAFLGSAIRLNLPFFTATFIGPAERRTGLTYRNTPFPKYSIINDFGRMPSCRPSRASRLRLGFGLALQLSFWDMGGVVGGESRGEISHKVNAPALQNAEMEGVRPSMESVGSLRFKLQLPPRDIALSPFFGATVNRPALSNG